MWKSLSTIGAATVLICLVMGDPRGCGAFTAGDALSFSRSCTTLARLSGSKATTRAEWLSVIESFQAIRRQTRGRIANRCLLMAGRASLGLYGRSHNPDDLDKAVEYFNDFLKINRSGPDFVPALRDLKSAHFLKRKLGTAACAKPRAPARSRVTKNSKSLSRTGNPAQSPGGGSPRTPVAPSPSRPFPASPAVAGGSGAFRLQGNPFCAVDQPPRQNVERATVAPARTAALPPPIVTEAATAARHEEKSQKAFIIVLDPGHGGKDPGAVSSDGRLKEKELTLDIAKRLRESLQRRIPQVKVHLTREEDRFLTLQERTANANVIDADLFISIHCNGATDSSFRGIETFYLSKASSPRALKVAARENAIPLAKMSDLEATLLDLMVTSKKTESDALARAVHRSMVRSIKGIMPASRDRGVKQAPFYVLLGAKMPAILVECAFISSSREKNKLNSSGYLDSVADGIAFGAESYLGSLGKNSERLPGICGHRSPGKAQHE